MIIQHLQKLVTTGEEVYAKVCTVHRVDRANKSCDLLPVDGSAELFDIPLQADVQGHGWCLFPAEGSHVLVVFINKHHACVCQVSEVDLMQLVADKMAFSVDKNQLTIKKDDTEVIVGDQITLKAGGENLKGLLDELFEAIKNLKLMTPQGPTTALMNAADFEKVKNKLNKLFA